MPLKRHLIDIIWVTCLHGINWQSFQNNLLCFPLPLVFELLKCITAAQVLSHYLTTRCTVESCAPSFRIYLAVSLGK